MSLVIFATGISGVGKSYFIKNFIDTHNEFCHLKGSDLLAKGLRNADPSKKGAMPHPKKELIFYQNLILEEFKKKTEEYENKIIIFDGHIIVELEKKLIPIPKEVIAGLGATKIIFLKGSPGEIQKRRAEDKDRIRSNKSVAEIDEEQSFALRVCRNISKLLNIEMDVINSNDPMRIEKSILRVMLKGKENE